MIRIEPWISLLEDLTLIVPIGGYFLSPSTVFGSMLRELDKATHISYLVSYRKMPDSEDNSPYHVYHYMLHRCSHVRAYTGKTTQ